MDIRNLYYIETLHSSTGSDTLYYRFRYTVLQVPIHCTTGSDTLYYRFWYHPTGSDTLFYRFRYHPTGNTELKNSITSADKTSVRGLFRSSSIAYKISNMVNIDCTLVFFLIEICCTLELLYIMFISVQYRPVTLLLLRDRPVGDRRPMDLHSTKTTFKNNNDDF